MPKINLCPFFRKCPSAYSLEKIARHLFFHHYCLGEYVSNAHIRIHHDNLCTIFKNNEGQEINACVYFQQCQMAAHRSVTSTNIYKVACLGIGKKSPRNHSCKQYKRFAKKTLANVLPLFQQSAKNNK